MPFSTIVKYPLDNHYFCLITTISCSLQSSFVQSSSGSFGSNSSLLGSPYRRSGDAAWAIRTPVGSVSLQFIISRRCIFVFCQQTQPPILSLSESFSRAKGSYYEFLLPARKVAYLPPIICWTLIWMLQK